MQPFQSKTIVSAFREARDTYRAKRAIKAEARQRQLDSYYEQEARKLHHEERRDRHYHHQHQQRQLDSFETEEERRARHAARRERRRQRERDAATRDQLQSDDSDSTTTTTTRDIYRHSNISSMTLSSNTNGSNSRSILGGGSLKEIIIPQPSITDDHLTALLLQVSDILDHISCFGSGVFAMIEALRRDPETLAMVGLTLAEISTIVTKLSPSMLIGLKSAWPMVFAFLASPQFAIVAGVGVGTTVVLIGGYKIIKRMGLVGGATTPAAIEEGADNEEAENFGGLKSSNSFPPRYEDLDLGGRVTGELDMNSLERELPAIEEAPTLTPVESLRETEVPQLAFDIPKSRPSKSRTKSSRSDHSTSSSSSSSRRRGDKERHSERERGDREGVRERRRRDHDYDRERISDKSR